MTRAFISPGEWARLSARRRFSSGRPIARITALTLIVLAAISYQVVAALGQVNEQTTSAGVLSQIEVMPETSESTDGGITAQMLTDLRALPDVERVSVDAEIGVYAADGSTWASTLRPVNLANLPPGITVAPGAGLDPIGVIVPVAIEGEALSVTPGSDLTVAFTQMTAPGRGELAERTLKVVGTYDPAWLGEGRATILGTDDLVVELLAAKHGLSPADYLATTGVPGALVTAATADDVTAVTAAIQGLGLDAAPVRDTLGELPGVVAYFPAVLLIVGVGFLVLLIVNVSSAVRAAVTVRRGEFALLRIRGWQNTDIRRLLLIDVGGGALRGAAVGTVIGTAVGALLGARALPAVTVSATFLGALAALLAVLVVVPTLVACLTAWIASARVQRADPFLSVMQPG